MTWLKKCSIVANKKYFRGAVCLPCSFRHYLNLDSFGLGSSWFDSAIVDHQTAELGWYFLIEFQFSCFLLNEKKLFLIFGLNLVPMCELWILYSFNYLENPCFFHKQIQHPSSSKSSFNLFYKAAFSNYNLSFYSDSVALDTCMTHFIVN